MFNMKYLSLLLSVICISCGGKYLKTVENYSLFAKEFCTCSEPLYKTIMEALSDLNDRGITNEEEIKASLDGIIKKSTEQAKACLNKKLGEEWVSIIMNDMEANRAIQNKCPKYAPIVIGILTKEEPPVEDQ